MSREQVLRLKIRLEVHRHELRLGIDHQLQYVRRAEPEPDTLDQAASGYEKESSIRRGNKEQQLLEMVESALGRIRDGSFGLCLSCGNDIAEKRLEAVPWTRYCIQCQEHFEH